MKRAVIAVADTWDRAVGTVDTRLTLEREMDFNAMGEEVARCACEINSKVQHDLANDEAKDDDEEEEDEADMECEVEDWSPQDKLSAR